MAIIKLYSTEPIIQSQIALIDLECAGVIHQLGSRWLGPWPCSLHIHPDQQVVPCLAASAANVGMCERLNADLCCKAL